MTAIFITYLVSICTSQNGIPEGILGGERPSTGVHLPLQNALEISIGFKSREQTGH